MFSGFQWGFLGCPIRFSARFSSKNQCHFVFLCISAVTLNWNIVSFMSEQFWTTQDMFYLGMLTRFLQDQKRNAQHQRTNIFWSSQPWRFVRLCRRTFKNHWETPLPTSAMHDTPQPKTMNLTKQTTTTQKGLWWIHFELEEGCVISKRSMWQVQCM